MSRPTEPIETLKKALECCFPNQDVHGWITRAIKQIDAKTPSPIIQHLDERAQLALALDGVIKFLNFYKDLDTGPSIRDVNHALWEIGHYEIDRAIEMVNDNETL